MLDQRGQLMRAVVGLAGCSTPSYDRALHALRAWLLPASELVKLPPSRGEQAEGAAENPAAAREVPAADRHVARRRGTAA